MMFWPRFGLPQRDVHDFRPANVPLDVPRVPVYLTDLPAFVQARHLDKWNRGSGMTPYRQRIGALGRARMESYG